MFIVGVLGIRNSVEAAAAAVVEREVAAGADDGFSQGPIHGEREGDESESEKEEKHMRRRWRSGLEKKKESAQCATEERERVTEEGRL